MMKEHLMYNGSSHLMYNGHWVLPIMYNGSSHIMSIHHIPVESSIPCSALVSLNQINSTLLKNIANLCSKLHLGIFHLSSRINFIGYFPISILQNSSGETPPHMYTALVQWSFHMTIISWFFIWVIIVWYSLCPSFMRLVHWLCAWFFSQSKSLESFLEFSHITSRAGVGWS